MFTLLPADSRGITGPVAVAPYLLRQDKKISMFAPRERDEGLEQLGHKGLLFCTFYSLSLLLLVLALLSRLPMLFPKLFAA